jgi:hypothetical protein
MSALPSRRDCFGDWLGAVLACLGLGHRDTAIAARDGGGAVPLRANDQAHGPFGVASETSVVTYTYDTYQGVYWRVPDPPGSLPREKFPIPEGGACETYSYDIAPTDDLPSPAEPA